MLPRVRFDCTSMPAPLVVVQPGSDDQMSQLCPPWAAVGMSSKVLPRCPFTAGASSKPQFTTVAALEAPTEATIKAVAKLKTVFIFPLTRTDCY